MTRTQKPESGSLAATLSGRSPKRSPKKESQEEAASTPRVYASGCSGAAAPCLRWSNSATSLPSTLGRRRAWRRPAAEAEAGRRRPRGSPGSIRRDGATLRGEAERARPSCVCARACACVAKGKGGGGSPAGREREAAIKSEPQPPPQRPASTPPRQAGARVSTLRSRRRPHGLWVAVRVAVRGPHGAWRAGRRRGGERGSGGVDLVKG